MNIEEETCPICIINEPNCYTECGHSYCINCLSKIRHCAICRKNLIRVNLCNEIRNKNIPFIPFTEYEIRIDRRPYQALLWASGLGGLTYTN